MTDHPHDRLLTQMLEESDRLRALKIALSEYAEALDSRSAATRLMRMVHGMEALTIEEVRARLTDHDSSMWVIDSGPWFISASGNVQ